MAKTIPSGLLRLLLTAIGTSLIVSCVEPIDPFSRTSRLDEGSDLYQGYPTVSTPEEFGLVAPATDSALTFMPAFVVTEVIGAEAYDVQVSTSSMAAGSTAFLEAIVFEVSGALSNISLPTGLTPSAGDYYWRSRCQVDGQWREWPSPAHFSIVDPYDLPQFQPPDNDAVLPHRTLEWNAVDGAVYYEIQVGASVLEMGSSPPILVGSAPSHELRNDVAGDIVHWRVRATDENGLCTTMSPSRVFHVVAALNPPVFHLTYDGNGSSSGSVPMDAGEYVAGDTVTVSDNNGRLIHESLLFGGWNTEPDGSGSSYLPGSTFSMADGNTRLYALWSATRVRREAPLRHIVDDSFRGGRGMVSTDVDRDGDADIVAAGDYDDDVTWWENDGLGNFTAHTIDVAFDGAMSVFAIDVDGDADTDVLGAAHNADDIAWWENDGSENFTKHTIDGGFDGASSVYAIDMDDDGDIDILGTARNADDVTWWENDGNEGFAEHTVDGGFDGASGVFPADIDGDGDTDILGAAAYSDTIAWWINDGAETFTKQIIANYTFDGASGVYATDVDSDGDVDVLGAPGNYTDDVTWWENDGHETFAEHAVADYRDGAFSVYATDVDDDGDVDILGPAYHASTITWWMNDGHENFSRQVITDDFGGASGVYAADLDGDSDMDIIGTGSGGVSWWSIWYD